MSRLWEKSLIYFISTRVLRDRAGADLDRVALAGTDAQSMCATLERAARWADEFMGARMNRFTFWLLALGLKRACATSKPAGGVH
jgi:hypothetical protein